MPSRSAAPGARRGRSDGRTGHRAPGTGNRGPGTGYRVQPACGSQPAARRRALRTAAGQRHRRRAQQCRRRCRHACEALRRAGLSARRGHRRRRWVGATTRQRWPRRRACAWSARRRSARRRRATSGSTSRAARSSRSPTATACADSGWARALVEGLQSSGATGVGGQQVNVFPPAQQALRDGFEAFFRAASIVSDYTRGDERPRLVQHNASCCSAYLVDAGARRSAASRRDSGRARTSTSTCGSRRKGAHLLLRAVGASCTTIARARSPGSGA